MGCGAPRAPGWFSQTCHPLWKHKVPNEDVECLLQKRKYKYSRHTNSTQNQPKNDWIFQSCHPLWESNRNGPVRRASRLMSVRAWPRFASQLWTSARHRQTTWEFVTLKHTWWSNYPFWYVLFCCTLSFLSFFANYAEIHRCQWYRLFMWLLTSEWYTTTLSPANNINDDCGSKVFEDWNHN